MATGTITHSVPTGRRWANHNPKFRKIAVQFTQQDFTRINDLAEAHQCSFAEMVRKLCKASGLLNAR